MLNALRFRIKLLEEMIFNIDKDNVQEDDQLVKMLNEGIKIGYQQSLENLKNLEKAYIVEKEYEQNKRHVG